LPRYFFDTYDGNQFVSDTEGLELKDVDLAKAGDQKTFIVSVRDEAGQVVLRAALSLIVETAP
jgi:hypothetical protein